MDKLGIEFWDGPQMTLYESWPLHVVRQARGFPEYYAYLPSGAEGIETYLRDSPPFLALEAVPVST